jgi:hypothetical protein
VRIYNNRRWGKFGIRLTKDDLTKHKQTLIDLMKKAYQENVGE